MDLLTILAQYKVIRDALKEGKYIAAWRGTFPVQEAMCNIAESVGFQAGPDDEATRAEIAECAEECNDLCKKIPKTAAATASFDWRTALMKILAALFEAWKPEA